MGRMENQSLLTKQEIAERLGVGVRAVDGMVRAKRIPFIRLGHRTLRFNWSEVEKAVAAYVVKSRNGAARI